MRPARYYAPAPTPTRRKSGPSQPNVPGRLPGRAACPRRRYQGQRGLTNLLAGRGDLDELRARANAGDKYAARRLTDLLADRGDLDELRARADTGDKYAARRLTDLLADRGDLDELRARANADDYAARRLAGLLADYGDFHEAAFCAPGPTPVTCTRPGGWPTC